MSAEGYVQVPADSAGRRVESLAVTIPAGTVVTGADGTLTTLTADTVLFRQVTVIGDPNAKGVYAAVRGEDDRGALAVDGPSFQLLEKIERQLRSIHFLLATALELDEEVIDAH